MQQCAGIYLLQNYSKCFGCLSHPLSGVHKTVTADSGTGHSVGAMTFRQRGLIRPRWRNVHRNSILLRSNKIEQYAGIYLLQNYSTCLECTLHPSSGVHKTVTAASVTGHGIRAPTFLQRGLIRPR